MALFSVIIPTYHRNDLLAQCLERLTPTYQQIPSDVYEVIVTDDGTTSTSKDLLSKDFPWVKWVKGPHKGPASNRNNGADKANGDWLIFTDDDCLPNDDLLRQYEKAISIHPESIAFEGAIEHFGNDLYRDDESYECPLNLEGGNFWSANICISKNTFQQLNGFDPYYPNAALEDQDLYYRLLETTTIPFVREAIVKHPFRKVYYLKKILRISKQAKDWAYHATKHQHRFHFSSKGWILWDSLCFYLKDTLRQLSKGRIKTACYDVVYLTWGNAVLANQLWKNRKK